KLRLERVLVRTLERAVGRLDRQLAHARQDRTDLGQRAFRGLREADAVAGVPAGLLEAPDLRAQARRDTESGGVIGGLRDAPARRQALEVPLEAGRGRAQLTLSRERRNVRIDSQTHDLPFIQPRVTRGRNPLQ